MAAAFALEEFLVPATILDGGIVGISMIISQLSPIPLGVLTFALNLPFLIVGAKNGPALLCQRRLLHDPVLHPAGRLFRPEERHRGPAAGSGLWRRAPGGRGWGGAPGGGCLDGTETVALLISRKTRLSVGQIVFGCNVIIYAAAGILFGLDRAMYSLLTYFITFKIIDVVENGMEEVKSVMIITEDGDYMANAIYHQISTAPSQRGTGLISGDKAVLYCVVTRIELPAIRRIIRQADQSAFVTISDVGEVIGNHMKQPPPKGPPLRRHLRPHPTNGRMCHSHARSCHHVTSASVTIDGAVHGQIGAGYLVLLGVGPQDTPGPGGEIGG